MPAYSPNADSSRHDAREQRSTTSLWLRLTHWNAARRRLRRWRRRSHYTYELPPRTGPTELHRVLARELEYIHRHRHPDQDEQMTQRSLIGLALSGGGIRSATTNLGVLQALARMQVLPLVDYMSTVSGGGYIGTCLSALLSWNGDAPAKSKDACSRFQFAGKQKPVFSTEWDHFPFRAEFREGMSRVGSDIVAHLRTHGNFLVAHLGFLTRHTLRGVGNFLTGILLNVSMFVFVLFVASALYMATALWVAPDMGKVLGNRVVPSGIPDTARRAMIDADSEVVRVRDTTCAPDDQSCRIEVRTTSQIPSLRQRIRRNALVVITTFKGVKGPDNSGGSASRSDWGLGSNGRFFPLALPVAFGAGLAVATFLLIGLLLKRYLIGEAAYVAGLRRGESAEDAFERRVLSWLAGLTAVVAFGALAVTRYLNPDALTGPRQLLWLFVPFAVIASTRVVSILIAVLLLPWLGARFWNRRMRSLWGAFQAITIYGWWLVLLMALMPVVIYALRDRSLTLGIGALGSLLLTRLLASKTVTQGNRLKLLAGRFRNTLLGILVVLVLVLGLLFFAAFFAGHDVNTPILWIAGIALLAFALFVDTNKLGPHFFYRDRLAETYLLSELPDPYGRLGVYYDAMEMPLRCLHGDAPGVRTFQNTAPYQLISAAINLAGSRDLTRKDRKSGYWLFSKLYCGSVHTGFRETAYYRGGETLLARAVAVSGAAASAAIGRFTFFAQAFATVLFNIRLGHWVENPRKEGSIKKQERWVFWPLYLWREVTMKTTETSRLVNLSDGGHTGDNIGIYPLFQRRCKVIIACDAECDPRVTFGSFTEALRQVYIDMGIWVDIDLTMIRPDKVTGLSRSHCAVGRIKYPDREDQESYLIYLKNSLTGDEPEPQLNYKTQSPDFPHESTSDLFFDDSQFESYRALGAHIAEDTFGSWVTTDLFDLVRRHHAPTTTAQSVPDPESSVAVSGGTGSWVFDTATRPVPA